MGQRGLLPLCLAAGLLIALSTLFVAAMASALQSRGHYHNSSSDGVGSAIRACLRQDGSDAAQGFQTMSSFTA